VLFRWDAPLFFANAEFFHQRVANAIDSAPTPVRWLVVAAEPVTSVDVTAADVIADNIVDVQDVIEILRIAVGIGS
jgi:MFS superfamily sulfate permease-like transporter